MITDQKTDFDLYLQSMLDRSRQALHALADYSQAQVDRLCQLCAQAVFDHAEELARLAVDETRMGVYEDKVAKNKNKAMLIWYSLQGKKSVGIIDYDPETGIARIAKPLGIIGAITPTTNPIVTCMSNAMFAVKCRNSIIIAPHPRAMDCSIRTVELMNQYLAGVGAPEHLIQIIAIKSLELTKKMMQSVDVVIATGGMDMVKSVYSSGKPALGVGAGNVQVLIDEDIDLAKAIEMIIRGRSFDNGIICTGEQSAHIPARLFSEAMKQFAARKGYVVPDSQTAAVRAILFPQGKMNRDLVGQNAVLIAEKCGLTVPADTRILVVKADDSQDLLGEEKMFPVLTVYPYASWEQAVDQARMNLDKIGKGHSIAIHSNNRDHIAYAALKCEVSRVVCNQTCATGGGGSFYNGLNPTNTLGCGSWGNNSISENLTYYHLMNVTRIADYRPHNPVPSDDDLWN